LDKNFFGAAFYEQHKESLRALRLNSFVRNGVLIEYNMLIQSTGINFTAAHYLNLQTACHFAVQKYSGKNGSNGSALPLNWLLQRTKKGSKHFRRTIDWDPAHENLLGELRVVATFFEITRNPVPEKNYLQILYGSWNWFFLGNKIRSFCFQFYNNSLGIGARLAARYEHSGIVIDSRCTFCVKSKSWVPHRETFLHLFYECQYITNIVKSFSNCMLKEEQDEGKARNGCLTGLYDNVPVKDSIFYVLTSIFLNYTIWHFRHKKTVPSLATLCHEVDYHFLTVANCSKKIADLASASDSPICRRWRAHGHGRG
jgi:hypothetical protein